MTAKRYASLSVLPALRDAEGDLARADRSPLTRLLRELPPAQANVDRALAAMKVVDEAWLLMRDPEGAKFLYRMAKAARKHWAGLTVITQDAADLLGSDLGQAVVANAATQILLRQAPQAIDQIGDAFGLSAGERQLLLAAERGEGLLVAGGHGRASTMPIAVTPALGYPAAHPPEELGQSPDHDHWRKVSKQRPLSPVITR